MVTFSSLSTLALKQAKNVDNICRRFAKIYGVSKKKIRLKALIEINLKNIKTVTKPKIIVRELNRAASSILHCQNYGLAA